MVTEFSVVTLCSNITLLLASTKRFSIKALKSLCHVTLVTLMTLNRRPLKTVDVFYLFILDMDPSGGGNLQSKGSCFFGLFINDFE